MRCSLGVLALIVIGCSARPATTARVTAPRPIVSGVPTSAVAPSADVVAETNPRAEQPQLTAGTERELVRLQNESFEELRHLCTNKNGYACFRLASETFDDNPELSRAAIWLACDFDAVPEACALFLEHQLAKIENPDFLSPKQLLSAVEAACSYQAKFCELLSDQSLKHAALGDIRGEFPEVVGGFKFGDAKDRVQKDCAGPGNSWVHDGSDVAACRPAPVDPFPFGDAIVLLHFCTGSLCEIALVFADQAHLTEAILEKLRAKYGDAAPSDPATVCASSTPRVSKHDSSFRWTWTDRRSDHTARQIVYDFSCNKGESVPRSPTIWYRNVDGTLRRLKQYQQNQANY